MKTYKKKGIKARGSKDALKVTFEIAGDKETDGWGSPYCYIQYIPKTDTFNAYTCYNSDCDGYIKTNNSENSENSEN